MDLKRSKPRIHAVCTDEEPGYDAEQVVLQVPSDEKITRQWEIPLEDFFQLVEHVLTRPDVEHPTRVAFWKWVENHRPQENLRAQIEESSFTQQFAHQIHKGFAGLVKENLLEGPMEPWTVSRSYVDPALGDFAVHWTPTMRKPWTINSMMVDPDVPVHGRLSAIEQALNYRTG